MDYKATGGEEYMEKVLNSEHWCFPESSHSQAFPYCTAKMSVKSSAKSTINFVKTQMVLGDGRQLRLLQEEPQSDFTPDYLPVSPSVCAPIY